ncbi:hypothetical protein [Allokutzneria oryzae]|uniref:Glycosyltransferase subfamily 4-like N-terminal domain-containing protein n=1 Tax=Allokutzneria oryzae TaxID=1378989 RepID=A0ABV5ZTL9_9PSEU
MPLCTLDERAAWDEGEALLRVVVLVNRYVPIYNAGSEVTMHRLARALVGAGHEVQVVITWHLSRNGYHLDGIRVHQVSERDADDRIVQLSPDVMPSCGSGCGTCPKASGQRGGVAVLS